MKLYIACALTHVPRDEFSAYVNFIHEVAHKLSSGGHEVRYALQDSDPQLAQKPFEERARLCYLWDRELVEEAEVVVAEASYPSIGLGIELQIATARAIPIIVCFQRTEDHRSAPVKYESPDHTPHMLQIGEGFVSLMALGLPTVFRVISYSTSGEGVARIVDAIALLRR